MNMTEQLLLKAIGSDSEEEAIACLRMARKKHRVEPARVVNGTVLTGQSGSSEEAALRQKVDQLIEMNKTCMANEVAVRYAAYAAIQAKSKLVQQLRAARTAIVVMTVLAGLLAFALVAALV